MDPIFHEARYGFKLHVYQNRIDIEEGTFIPKKRTIPLRSVTNVTIAGLTRKLQITTSDGKKHEFTLRDAEGAREAILSSL